MELERIGGKSEPMFHLPPSQAPFSQAQLCSIPSSWPRGPSSAGRTQPFSPTHPPQLFSWSSKILPVGCGPSRPALGGFVATSCLLQPDLPCIPWLMGEASCCLCCPTWPYRWASAPLVNRPYGVKSKETKKSVSGLVAFEKVEFLSYIKILKSLYFFLMTVSSSAFSTFIYLMLDFTFPLCSPSPHQSTSEI